MDGGVENTDREIYRAPDETGCGDYYSDSIFVTKDGGIGINVGGLVIVRPLRYWHSLARDECLPTAAEVRGIMADQADYEDQLRAVGCSDEIDK